MRDIKIDRVLWVALVVITIVAGVWLEFFLRRQGYPVNSYFGLLLGVLSLSSPYVPILIFAIAARRLYRLSSQNLDRENKEVIIVGLVAKLMSVWIFASNILCVLIAYGLLLLLGVDGKIKLH